MLASAILLPVRSIATTVVPMPSSSASPSIASCRPWLAVRRLCASSSRASSLPWLSPSRWTISPTTIELATSPAA